jgi:hypothetical protein
MSELAALLNGAGLFIIACVSLYNAVAARGRAQRIETLETNTNSIKDALIKSIGEAEYAKGVLHGKTEVK